MSTKRPRPNDNENDNNPDNLQPTFSSNPIEDRSSKFLAVYSPNPTLPPKTLQAHAPFTSATHRMLAWRKPSTQTSLSGSKRVYDLGSDDDGEKYAGKKLEKLLVEMDVVGVVVVARWYGGVMLGPVRFEHIVGVAREAIGMFLRGHGSGRGGEGKRVKLDGEGDVGQVEVKLTAEEEEEVKGRLVRQLRERDRSIEVLRGLLVVKRVGVELSSTPDGPMEERRKEGEEGKPVKAGPKYEVMPLNTLRQLEKAKDTSIKWILKQIDDAEAEGENDEKSAKQDG